MLDIIASARFAAPGVFARLAIRDAQESRRIVGRVVERGASNELLSATPLEKLPQADAATWLDRTLTQGGDRGDWQRGGFSGELETALNRRRQWLIEQGLAQEQDGKVLMQRNLLAVLRRRELARRPGTTKSATGTIRPTGIPRSVISTDSPWRVSFRK
jgi:hypothetical protein